MLLLSFVLFCQYRSLTLAFSSYRSLCRCALKLHVNHNRGSRLCQEISFHRQAIYKAHFPCVGKIYIFHNTAYQTRSSPYSNLTTPIVATIMTVIIYGSNHCHNTTFMYDRITTDSIGHRFFLRLNNPLLI